MFEGKFVVDVWLADVPHPISLTFDSWERALNCRNEIDACANDLTPPSGKYFTDDTARQFGFRFKNLRGLLLRHVG